LYTGPFSAIPPVQIQAAAFDNGYVSYSATVSVLLVPYYFLTNATAGGGSVQISNGRLPTVSGPYRTNAQRSLTAVAPAGWTFLQWQGDVSGTNPITSIAMNGPRTVQAVFGHGLTVAIQGADGASGVISNSPPGPLYAYGQTVSLSGIPDTNSLLAGWGNGGTVEFTANPLPLTIDENH